MKLLIALVTVFFSLTLNAKNLEVSTNMASYKDQTTVTIHIDKKKSRKHKKSNKRRKKACANWAKRSYAG